MAWKCVVSFLGVALLGCTSPNPRSCADGFCNDPALPFCDVDGAIEGVPQVCVAVACTPGDFVACRGDEAISCNADGSNYEVTACPLGCEAATGCKLCEPNQTACTNGTVATCDAAGNIVSSEKCYFGCFDDEPRCRDLDPSNALAMHADMVALPADLTLDGADINTESGDVAQQGQPVSGITSFLVPATNGGAMVRVIVAKDVRLKDVNVQRDAASDPASITTGPALAIVATGSIRIDGRLTIYGGAGGVDIAGCSGGAGAYEVDQGRYLTAGHGGGGHATAGARGGDVGSAEYLTGGAAGMISGNAMLVPLRGGCPGRTAPGGGAIQLSARGQIIVDGVIDVRGYTPRSTGGGGGGGGILLEAARVELTSAARLIAIGGGGGAGDHYEGNYNVTSPNDDGTPQAGTRCGNPSIYCTAGGNGAAPGIGATPGILAAVPATAGESGAGGGGGGLGRIRINTRDQTYVKASSTIEAGELTVGVAATR